MSGSVFGNIFKISTWGESHGKALGVVIDGCPAGVELNEEIIQKDMDRRKPGASKYGTKRSEGDKVQILSGVFEGKTTGTPISLVVFNEDQRSRDYSNIMNVYRPGHADFGFDSKYGFRDYRGGGRSSGRETAARVAAGAVAKACLKELGVDIFAFTRSVGKVSCETFDRDEITANPLCMSDREACEKAAALMDDAMKNGDSVGGVIEGRISGLPVGIGETVFDKLDAVLAKAIMSIGAVKGIEFGAGFSVALLRGSENNDPFVIREGKPEKAANNSGGILGGMSDGNEVVFRAAFKPTPSILIPQKTINRNMEETEIVIKGRHDPIIVPRAVVVVESMAAVAVFDLMLMNMSSRMDNIKNFYNKGV
ncbi:MAG: chorismate synthase [Clostridiales bacterium]|nr:chorismate synthase [Clostridiales bacterium]